MIDKETYNERLDELIEQLKGLRITDETSSMSEIDRVACIGGISLQLETWGQTLEDEIKNT
jgi:hypothetical protein